MQIHKNKSQQFTTNVCVIFVKKYSFSNTVSYAMMDNTGKGKGKVHPSTDNKGPEGERSCSSTLSLTSALDGVGGQHHAPTSLPPGKAPCPFIGG